MVAAALTNAKQPSLPQAIKEDETSTRAVGGHLTSSGRKQVQHQYASQSSQGGKLMAKPQPAKVPVSQIEQVEQFYAMLSGHQVIFNRPG